jgi:phosphoribosylformylglycinamidine cyclo-ligase
MDYREAGVDISAADAAKARIGRLARSTFNPGVLSEIGSFGGLFRPDLSRYREPVLVASTDGVGTKIKVAIAAGVHDTVGYDLVAHCVDDILVQGAVPLFFLDYIALGRMDPLRVEQIVSGFARACSEFSCPLIGGETAEMPGMYSPGEYDLAGFAVGVVEKDRILDGSRIAQGDVVLGLASSGAHSNGYSLIRRILERDATELSSDFHGRPLADVLLAPTRIYVKPVLALMQQVQVKGLAHITGGGLTDNVPRILPEGCSAVFHRSAIEVLGDFRQRGQGFGQVGAFYFWPG